MTETAQPTQLKILAFGHFTVLWSVAQSCPALCDPTDWSHQAPLSMGILQARILEWVAMPSFRGFS